MRKFKNPLADSPGLRLTMAVTAFIAGGSFCFASNAWHNSRIFYYINQIPLPWWLYGVILLVGGVCMFIHQIRPVGFLLAAVLYSFFAITMWLGVLGGLHSEFLFLQYLHYPPNTVGSFYAAGNATTLAVLYWTSLKYSIYDQVDPERNNILPQD